MNTMINTLLVATVAIFFTITVMNNIVDFDNTHRFVQHTLRMDTTNQNPHFMWRAIQSDLLQKLTFCAIIFLQSLIAIILWSSAWKMLAAAGVPIALTAATQLALLGLALGFVLYALGFITLAGQWFMMRESTTWNVTMPSHVFMTLIGFVMVMLKA